MLRANYVMYSDFECFTKSQDDETQQHEPNSYGLVGVRKCCGGQSNYDEPTKYRGEDPVSHFLETVVERAVAYQEEPKKVTL